MDASEVLAVLDREDNESLRSFSSEHLDLLVPIEDQGVEEDTEEVGAELHEVKYIETSCS